MQLLAHPLRVAILRHMLEHGQAWPARLAAELGAGLPNVGYHVGRLREAGEVVLVRTVPKRGAVAHVYRLRDPEATRDALRRDELGAHRPGAADVAASVAAREQLRRALGEARRLRVEQGATRQAFALKLGITSTRLGRIERGEADPPFTLVIRIVHELRITVGEIFTRTEP